MIGGEESAVRALAGAIVQRAPDASALHVPAQGIVAVTGEMQDGVRRILQRLRPSATGLAEGLEQVFAGVLPHVVAHVLFVALLIAFPQIILWLPSTMGP